MCHSAHTAKDLALFPESIKNSIKNPHTGQKMDKIDALCMKCHSQSHVRDFYEQAELTIPSTNAKVAEAKALEQELRDEGLLTPEPFDEAIEFKFFNIWHHWGRTIKHGAFMGGADYTQWHGNYELLKDWVEVQEMAEDLRAKAHRENKPSTARCSPGRTFPFATCLDRLGPGRPLPSSTSSSTGLLQRSTVRTFTITW